MSYQSVWWTLLTQWTLSENLRNCRGQAAVIYCLMCALNFPMQYSYGMFDSSMQRSEMLCMLIFSLRRSVDYCMVVQKIIMTAYCY